MLLPSVGIRGLRHIVVAIDTSASMDENTLAIVLAEVDKIRSVTQGRLTILQCDARIQKVEHFEALDRAEPFGGQGNDFRTGRYGFPSCFRMGGAAGSQ